MSYSYKGKILISTPDVSGDIFSRSVVLIVDHNDHGAFGLILNKKIKDTEVQNISSGLNIQMYDGGPMEKEKIFFITKGNPVTENHMVINENYYITEDLGAIMNALEENYLSLYDFKTFSGYSGWAAQQLESEIQRKCWTVVDIYNLDYTLPNDLNLWKTIMQNLGGEFLIWANTPEDVSMN